jgi:hypothetical protein
LLFFFKNAEKAKLFAFTKTSPMLKRKQTDDEESSGSEINPILKPKQTDDEESSGSEIDPIFREPLIQPQNLLNYSSEEEDNQFEKRNKKTGELHRNKKSVQRFIDIEAIHESDSDCSTSEDEHDTTGLDDFVDEEELIPECETSNSDSEDEYFEASSSDEDSDDSYVSKKPAMDDLRTIKEGQSIVENGYAFPQDADLSQWYHRP